VCFSFVSNEVSFEKKVPAVPSGFGCKDTPSPNVRIHFKDADGCISHEKMGGGAVRWFPTTPRQSNDRN
jgi:hypothetical protein